MATTPARKLVGIAGWLVLVPTVGFVVARIGGLSDRLGRMFALESLTLVLLLPAYVVLLVALGSRRRVLAGAALVVVLCHLAWVGPDVRWWPRERATGRGPVVRVVSTNLYAGNGRVAAAAEAVARLRPDVLVAVELTPAMARALGAQPALAPLRHRFSAPHRGNTFGAAIWSRYPLTSRHRLDMAGFPLLRVTAELPGGPISVFAVHTLQPLAGLGVLRRQLAELDYDAEHTRGPMIMAGDFNATRQHRDFRALVQHGLHDAHLQRGRGLATSWPMNRPGPAFALLDHVLVSRDLVVRDVDEATIPGSDHRAIVTQLRRR